MTESAHPAAPAGVEVRAKDLAVAVDSGGRPVLLLDAIDLTLVPGELLALVGPNGSGKTTLLRSLSRILKPVSGAVMLDERDLYREVDARSAAKKIGVVPQETQVAFDFTAREVVAMGRSPHRPPLALLSGESEADRRAVDAALERAGVAPALADRSILSLSGGERQRVLIARALAQEAGVLLLDEPTAALDIKHEGRLLAWLRELAISEKRTIMVVLHDLNLAAAFADRVVVLDKGRVVAQGTPEEALTAERIRAVYGMPVWVRRHPATGRPYILSLPASLGEDSGLECFAGVRVHVLGGGGAGAPLMMRVSAAGALVSTGPINVGDTDEEAAALLSIPHCVAPPYSVLSADLIAQSIAMGADARFVVVCEIPFGDGNAGMLDVAATLAGRGVQVVLAASAGASIADRDFTRGKTATAAWEKLRALPGVMVGDPVEIMGAALAGPSRSNPRDLPVAPGG